MESIKKSFKIGNDLYEEVVEGLPQPGDQLVNGVLYRKVENKPAVKNGSKVSTQTPAETKKELPAHVTTHWYDGITPKRVLAWLGVGFLVALAIVVIIAIANIRIIGQTAQPAAAQPAAAQPAAAQPAAAQPAVAQPAVWKDHMTWSVGGDTSFTATDGVVSEMGSDLFTDESQGALSLDITPDKSDPVCLLQYGQTSIHTEPFKASFAANSNGAGFRIIAKSAWDNLTPADGAYDLCWKR